MAHLLQLIAYSLMMMISTLIMINTASFGSAADCGPLSVRKLIVVDQNGKGQFKTVQAAIDSIPENNGRWVEIQINPGLYIEKVEIEKTKQCLYFKGSSRMTTTISYDAHSNTAESATFTSWANNLVVRGITFKNSYNRYWSTNGEGDSIIQAVAAKVNGDKSLFYDCGFQGVQDTLWDAKGRHYFYDCYIEGAVDFIFGRAQSYYEDCVMNATVGVSPHDLRIGYVTANGRESENDPSGFVFKGGAVLGGKNVYLGRAYRPYSRVVFDGTALGDGVNPLGWDSWNYAGKEDKFFFGEVKCTGKGADLSGRVSWIKKNIRESDLQQLSLSSFVDQDGWLATQPLADRIRRRRLG